MVNQEDAFFIQREATNTPVSMSYMSFFLGWLIDGDVFIFGFINGIPYLGRHSYSETEQFLSCAPLVRPG